MITINQLRVKYQEFTALDVQQKIEINATDRVGVIGSNGAGKTTFVKACLGLVPFEGEIMTQVPPQKIAVHMQSNEYVETMQTQTIMETVLNTTIKENPKLNELIAFFDFEKHLKKRYKNLSGGLKQRFTLIMVLMQDSPITFFDEVTTGLDFATRQSLIKKILAWYEGKDACIIFITHYYEELEQLTNKLLILNEGRVVDFGERQYLFNKYCGHSVIVFNKKENIESFLSGYQRLLAPQEMWAVSCQTPAEEVALVKLLIEKNINFKRSTQDIEILSMNAIGGEIK